MDREYIIYGLEKRMSELKQVYKDTVKQVGVTGHNLSYGSSRVLRSKAKQDLQLCALLYVMAQYMDNDTEIEDEDAIMAYHRLVEPKRRNVNGF